jgi:hypothetical protein
MSETLRRIIREVIIEELELDETTSSGAAGPYNTPFAFRGNSAEGKAKAKKNATIATGYSEVEKTQEKADEAGPQDNDPVTFGEKGKGGLKAPAKEKVIQEAGSQAELFPDEDRMGKKCRQCKKGTYQETGIQDDMHGELHCNKCGAMIKRHGTPENKKKNENIVSESRYDDFKMAEGTTRKKIGEAIREINRQIGEVHFVWRND